VVLLTLALGALMRCVGKPQVVPPWYELESALADHKFVAPVPSHVHPAWIVEFRDLHSARYGKLPRLNALAMHWCGQRASDAIALTEWYKARATEWGIAEILRCLTGCVACECVAAIRRESSNQRSRAQANTPQVKKFAVCS